MGGIHLDCAIIAPLLPLPCLVMRYRMLGLVRSFGTQSDKDFFFHNLAKTGEVACKGFN